MSEQMSSVDTRTVDTGLFLGAGAGTRMATATLDTPKFMLPIYTFDQAIHNIDLAVSDGLRGGLTTFVFVVTEQGKEAIEGHFGPMNPDTAATLKRQGKTALLDAWETRQAAMSPESGITIKYVIQPPDAGYGTAVPVDLARKALEDVEHFVISGGDDGLWHDDGTSELGVFIKDWQNGNADHGVLGKLVPRDQAPNYGVLRRAANGLLEAIVEKPDLNAIEEAEPAISLGRFIVGKEVWDYMDEYFGSPSSGERMLPDVINLMARDGTISVHTAEGEYYDTGTLDAMRATNNFFATRHLTLF